MIDEIRIFVRFVDHAQRMMRSESGLQAYKSFGSTNTQSENIAKGASGFVHYLQFLMYFYRIKNLSEVRELQFKHK